MSAKTCPRCAFQNTLDARFCVKCGDSLGSGNVAATRDRVPSTFAYRDESGLRSSFTRLRESWLGFFLALVVSPAVFFALHPVDMNATGVPLLDLLSTSAYYNSVMPYYHPEIIPVWFVAFLLAGILIDEKDIELGYVFSGLIIAISLSPLLGGLPPVDAAFNFLGLFILSCLWPLTLLVSGDWGNLLLLFSTMVFGLSIGSMASARLKTHVRLEGRKPLSRISSVLQDHRIQRAGYEVS